MNNVCYCVLQLYVLMYFFLHVITLIQSFHTTVSRLYAIMVSNSHSRLRLNVFTKLCLGDFGVYICFCCIKVNCLDISKSIQTLCNGSCTLGCYFFKVSHLQLELTAPACMTFMLETFCLLTHKGFELHCLLQSVLN